MSTTASVAEYYEDAAVRARLLEYCGSIGGGPCTAAYIAGFDPADQPSATWVDAARVSCSELTRLTARGCDLSRSLADSTHLIFLLDLDYQNIDYPGRPFTDPIDVFFKLENTYAVTRSVLRHFGIEALSIATGRGYHFVGQIALDDPVVDALADLAPTPSWFPVRESQRLDGMSVCMTERQARASAGLGFVLEYLAHQILGQAAENSLVAVVLNGTVVGSGQSGRECVSIDFSHTGDPLDVRYVRMPFSTYQWHRGRLDIFGEAVARRPILVALPRTQPTLEAFLLAGRDLEAGRRLAAHVSTALPDIGPGVANLRAAYAGSSLAQFHRRFLAERRAVEAADLNVPASLPRCVRCPLEQPNDLLLKPEYIQHLVRGLMSRGWPASRVAALIEREYLSDHNWGDRWRRIDPRTRADFDVRVFAGLLETGLDHLVDFNCTSSQEKGLCPFSGCRHDLRDDRNRLWNHLTS